MQCTAIVVFCLVFIQCASSRGGTPESVALASGLKANMKVLDYQNRLLVNQSFSRVATFQPVFQTLLTFLDTSRKIKEIAQEGTGATILKDLLNGLEADACLWFQYVTNIRNTTRPFKCTRQDVMDLKHKNEQLRLPMATLYTLLPNSNNQQNENSWVQSNFQSKNSTAAIRDVVRHVFPSVSI